MIMAYFCVPTFAPPIPMEEDGRVKEPILWAFGLKKSNRFWLSRLTHTNYGISMFKDSFDHISRSFEKESNKQLSPHSHTHIIEIERNTYIWYDTIKSMLRL